MKCCVLTRFVYELIYLDSFIEHYVNLGFDKIIVLYHDIVVGQVPNEYKDKVKLHNVPNLGNQLPDKFKHLIPEDIDWVLHVDSDEFLLLHKRYKDIHEYVECKLAMHPEINIFLFMWSWVHKYDEDNQYLNDIFRKYKKKVGNRLTEENKKNKQNEVWVKSMFKRSHLDTLYIHCPSMIYGYYMYCNELIVHEDENNNKIKSLLYKNKQNEIGFYQDVILMHLATRSMKNVVFKSQNMHKTQVKKKNMNNQELLEEYLQTTNLEHENEYDIMSSLKDYVGYKIEWPMTCLKMNDIVINLEDFLREQKYKFLANYKEKYYSLFEDSIVNDERMQLAMNKVINRFNIIFIE
jgi:hypothetical protein